MAQLISFSLSKELNDKIAQNPERDAFKSTAAFIRHALNWYLDNCPANDLTENELAYANSIWELSVARAKDTYGVEWQKYLTITKADCIKEVIDLKAKMNAHLQTDNESSTTVTKVPSDNTEDN